jgi:uroporphyrinogen-III synthase
MSAGSAKPVVWVTRPPPGAEKTAAALSQMGYRPVIVTLTEIASCAPEIDLATAFKADFIAVTSANAVRHLPDGWLEPLRMKTVHAVGDTTKAEAESFGFAEVHSARGNLDDLVSAISMHEAPGRTCLYLCGRVRTGDLEGKLAKGDYSCLVAEIYEAKEVSQLTEVIAAACDSDSPDAVLLHSALSAELLADFIQQGSGNSLDNEQFIAISERVARALPDGVRDRVSISAAPDEDALLRTLQLAVGVAGN